MRTVDIVILQIAEMGVEAVARSLAAYLDALHCRNSSTTSE
jgi:hypothetical protein